MTKRGRLEKANQRVGALRMFFKRRLRDGRRAQMIVFRKSFSFLFHLGLYTCWSHKRGIPLFLGLSFHFTTVFSDQRFNILTLAFWRVLLLCTSRSLFNSELQNISTWSRDIPAVISWIYNLRDFGSRRSTTESCDRYVRGFFLLFLDLPSLISWSIVAAKSTFIITICTGYVSGGLTWNDRFDLGCPCLNMCELAKSAKHRLMNRLWQISHQDTYLPCWKKENFHWEEQTKFLHHNG